MGKSSLSSQMMTSNSSWKIQICRHLADSIPCGQAGRSHAEQGRVVVVEPSVGWTQVSTQSSFGKVRHAQKRRDQDELETLQQSDVAHHYQHKQYSTVTERVIAQHTNTFSASDSAGLSMTLCALQIYLLTRHTRLFWPSRRLQQGLVKSGPRAPLIRTTAPRQF